MPPPSANSKKRAAPPSDSGQVAVASGSKGALVFKKSAKKARSEPVSQQASKSQVPSRAASNPTVTNKNASATSKNGGPLKSALKKRTDNKMEPKALEPSTSKKATFSNAPSTLVKGMAAKDLDRKGKKPQTASDAPNISKLGASTTWIQPPSPLPSFRIVAGSYERLLYGLTVSQTSTSSDSDDLKLQMTPIFQFPAHPSAIKCLATAGSSSKHLITAGADELIKIWDLRRKRELGSLSGAEIYGSPLSVDFPLSSHMLLTAQGVILLYRTRDWALLHTFKGHTGRVNFIATHPSAKLALSGGQDGVLRAWDLTRGKALGGTKMGMGDGGEMEALRWFGDGKGDFFALLGRTVVRIFRRNMSEVARIGEGTQTSTRLNGLAAWDLTNLRTETGAPAPEGFKGKSLLFVAREDKKVGIYLFDRQVFDSLDAESAKKEDQAGEGSEEEEGNEEEEAQRTLSEIGWLEGHNSRVKSVSLQPLSVSAAGAWTLTATTISSDGFIRIFDLGRICSSTATSESLATLASPMSLQPCAEFTTKGSRLTCLSVVGGDGSLGSGSSVVDEDEDRSSDDGEDADGDSSFTGFGDDGDIAVVSEDDEDEGLDDDEREIKKLEAVLKKAQREGIDLDELMRMAEDGELEDDASEADEEELEVEGDDDDDGDDAA